MKTFVSVLVLLVVLYCGMVVGKNLNIARVEACSLFSSECRVSYSVNFGDVQLFTIGE